MEAGAVVNRCETCHFYTGPDIAEAERKAASNILSGSLMEKEEGVCLALPGRAVCVTPYRQASIHYRNGMEAAQ